MIKMVYCITRKDGISREAFQKTWLEDHGPLVKRYAETIKALRYVQSHTGMENFNQAFIPTRGLTQPYDGITEIWWENIEQMQAGSSTPEGLEAAAALLEDEKRFIDLERSSIWTAEENVVVAG